MTHTNTVVTRVVRMFAALCRPRGASHAELGKILGLNGQNSTVRYVRAFRVGLPADSGLTLVRSGRRGETRFAIRPKGEKAR